MSRAEFRALVSAIKTHMIVLSNEKVGSFSTPEICIFLCLFFLPNVLLCQPKKP